MIVFAFFHHSHKPLHHCRIVVGEKRAFRLIQRGNRLHILLIQCKIEYMEVFFHPLFMRRLWNDHHAPLQMPAQHDLCRGLAVFFSDCGKNGIFKQTSPALAKGCPCLDLYLVFIHIFLCECLLPAPTFSPGHSHSVQSIPLW